MKEKIIDSTKDILSKHNVWIDDCYYEKEGSINFLRIVLDSDNFIDLNTVVKVTRMINPILDKLDLIDEEYTLDVYAKHKESENNE